MIDMEKIKFIRNNHFKPTEIGEIPEDWDVVKLGEVAELKQGKTPKREEYDNLKGFRIIKAKDFMDKEYVDFRASGERSFVKVDLGENYLLKSGDILVLSAAHSSTAVGQKIGFVKENPPEKSFYVAELIRIRATVDKYFIFALLHLENLRKQIKERVKGGHLYPTDLANVKLPLPPLPEQKAIAFVLSTIQEAKEKKPSKLFKQRGNLKNP